MANLKPVVRTNQTKLDGKCNIKIRVSHDHKTGYLSTPWDIEPEYMTRNGYISNKYPGASKLNMNINLVLAKYNAILIEIGPEIDLMDFNTLMARLRGRTKYGSTFTTYMKHRIDELIQEKRFSYAESYQVTLLHLEGFTGKQEIQFKEITFSFLKDFEGYLRHDRKAKVNTIRIYINNIRAVFNHALDAEIINLPSPFRKMKIRQERPQKQSLEIEELIKLKAGSPFPAQRRAVDLFFLSIYLAGTNLKDLLYFTSDNIKKGHLRYRRAKMKGKQTIDLRIRVPQEAQAIIEKYKGEKYLLDLMDPDDSYEAYKLALKAINKRLRMAGKAAGVETRLSFGMARNTWATLAFKVGVSKNDIDFALAHNLTSMTDEYINYDQLYHRIDSANEKVLKLLRDNNTDKKTKKNRDR